MDASKVVIRIVRDDGKGDANPEFVIDGYRWRIPSDGLEGFGGVGYDVSTQAYAQYDGSALLAERVPEMDRTITAVSNYDARQAREDATAFFIPRRTYEVHCSYMGRERYFTGRQYKCDVSTGNIHRAVTLTWTCLCLEPMWLGEEERRGNLSKARPKFGFPFLSWARRVAPEPVADRLNTSNPDERHVAGFCTGVISRTITMSNDGAAIAYPRFVVTATDAVANPRIKVLDAGGETVLDLGIEITMKRGDVLVCDYSRRPTEISLNGANVSHKVMPGCTLAAGIDLGTFSLAWSADSGDAALNIEPYIRERYTTA